MDIYTTCNSDIIQHGIWYCSSCGENKNVESKTGTFNSIFHQLKERLAFTVENYEIDNAQKIRKILYSKMLLKIVKINIFTFGV